MNERDSEIMAQLLGEQSYLRTTHPEKADLVLINTCSIRGKAAQKAYSCFGRFRKLKEKNRGLILAVTGCVAQQDGETLSKKMPFIDIVMGPQAIYALPSLVKKARAGYKPQILTVLSPDFRIPAFLPKLAEGPAHKRFVTIMQGCDNFCTYCVVPYTRGREISRNPDDIITEIEHLIAQGVKDITLLGQNVNSYGKVRGASGEGRFPELLRKVAAIDGLSRLRFTTSHPKDLSHDLMRCFADLSNLCPHFHLPVQSGSNLILQRMNRNYSIENYFAKIKDLRGYCPEIALTTDIIVGFPGETDDDFAATMDLLDKVRYHGAYTFKYSDRPQAKASEFQDKVAEEVKKERLAILQTRQEEISHSRRQELLGKTVEIMVDGKSKAAGKQWSGRTVSNQIVNFACDLNLVPGQLLMILVKETCQNSLRGDLSNP